MTERNTATEREYTPGTVLFEEDDPGEAMYVIRSGRVKIYRRSGERELVLAFLTDGEFFGEMALLENLPRSAAAMVVEPSFLIKVSAATFEEMIRRNIEIAVRIMRKLSGRVRTLDSRLEKLLLDTAVARAIEVLRWLQTQGMLEDGWIRVKDVGKHFDLGAQAGIPVTQAVFVQEQLERAGCMKFDGADLLIGEKHTLDSYVGFLELKREYGMGGTIPTRTTTPSRPTAPRPCAG